MLYLNMIDDQPKLWNLEKVDNVIKFEEFKFQIQTKDELSKHLLYFRTRMKLELDRKVNDFDQVYIANLLEKKVYLLHYIILF